MLAKSGRACANARRHSQLGRADRPLNSASGTPKGGGSPVSVKAFEDEGCLFSPLSPGSRTGSHELGSK